MLTIVALSMQSMLESRMFTFCTYRVPSIVFVHGLRGHPRRTWEAKKVMSKESKGMGMKKGKGKLKDKFLSSISLRSKRPNSPVPEGGNSVAEEDEENENTSTFWPADLLPLAIPSARIWTYGYNADVIGLFSANNKNSILQHGNDLMVKLERALGSNTVTTSMVRSTWQVSNLRLRSQSFSLLIALGALL